MGQKRRASALAVKRAGLGLGPSSGKTLLTGLEHRDGPHLCGGFLRVPSKAWGAWVVRPVNGAGRGFVGEGHSEVEGPWVGRFS